MPGAIALWTTSPTHSSRPPATPGFSVIRPQGTHHHRSNNTPHETHRHRFQFIEKRCDPIRRYGCIERNPSAHGRLDDVENPSVTTHDHRTHDGRQAQAAAGMRRSPPDMSSQGIPLSVPDMAGRDRIPLPIAPLRHTAHFCCEAAGKLLPVRTVRHTGRCEIGGTGERGVRLCRPGIVRTLRRKAP